MSSKPIAVVFLARTECAGSLADSLGAEGIEPVLARSSDEFYRVLNHQRVDLVVIENELHGFLSGMEILERLYNDLLRPPTVLLAQMTNDLQERSRKVGVDRILPPSCSQGEIVDSAKGLLAASNLSQVVIPLAARKLVQQSDVIRPLPQILLKLYGYLDHETASMTDLAQDLSVDPKMTAELLKLTNSTAFGLRRKVAKVLDAVTFLGIRRTVSLVLSAAVINAQSRIFRQLPPSIRTWYHQRSVLIASTAYTFARSLDDVSPDNAFILGLLQDVGILVLAHAYEQRYLPLLERSREIGQLRLEIIEMQDLHTTHAEVSAALLQKWELPQSLVSLVLAHHTPKGRAERSKTDERFLHVMQVGEAIANLSDNPAPQRYQTLAQLLESYGVDRAQQCKACVAEAVAKTAESSRLFSIPVPDDAAMLRLLQKATGGDGPQRTFAPNAARAADVAAAEPAEPAVPEPVPLTIPTRPSRQPAAARRQVLLIDDDKALCRSVLRTLAAAGLEAQTCQTGAEARMLAEQAAVILCDVHLESDSGIGLVRELRAGGFTGPVLMISGDCSRATVQECIEAGVADYLIKPFNRAALLEKLRKHAGWIFQSPVPPPTFPTHVSDQAVVGGSVKDSGG